MKKETDNYIRLEPGPESIKKPIRVLEIIGTATRGGMETQIINLLNNLPPGQFSITCICPCESLFTDTLRQIGVEGVYITPLADDPEWRSVQMAMEVIKLHNIEVIHAHMPKSHVLAAIAGSLLHIPVVATLHGMHVTAHELGIALAAKSHVITNCQETYIQALALGLPAQRVNLFHNGVDTKQFIPGGAGKKFRLDNNVPEDAVLVGFAGRLEWEKGPDLFVRAAAVIHQQLPDVHFAIAGAGSMLPQLQQLARQLGLNDQLHFTDWCRDTMELYPAFSIMAHTSRNDGTSLVLLEAMACGIPVVGMAVGGVREMISNEYTGMQVPANDWEALGAEIIKLLQQPATMANMGKAARQRVERNFNVQQNAQKTGALLRHVATLAAMPLRDTANDKSVSGFPVNGLTKKHA